MPGQGRSKTVISVPKRMELKDPAFQLKGQRMVTPRKVAQERPKESSLAVVLSSNSSFYLPLVVSGIKMNEVITKEMLTDLRQMTPSEDESLPCQTSTRVKVMKNQKVQKVFRQISLKKNLYFLWL